MNEAFFIILMSTFCIIFTEAVEVYKAGADGKPAWKETSEMRDRSTVPRPSQDDLAKDYRRRSKIPVQFTNYRSRSSDIPRPSQKDILEDYRRRSKIAKSYRRRNRVPVPQAERTRGWNSFKTQNRRAASKNYLDQKKNIIDRIFFTIPFGAQFPIYFASKSKKGTNKKSKVTAPVSGLVPHNRVPFRLQTWGLPINYRPLNGERYQMPYIENQAIARQHIIPKGDDLRFLGLLGYNRGYLRPRSFSTSRLLSGRKIIPYTSYRNQANAVQNQLQSLPNRRITKRRNSKTLENPKDAETLRKAVISKEFS